ncbi:MAG: hypothetical protein QME60_04210 [Verrucomicrobiota bacterium]|nr:hypothetical protein [Verrucomicrobiota bacterium]
MRRRSHRLFEKGGVELAGEALNLIRAAPLRITACYYVGTLPFALGALYFWADMSRSAFADERCLGLSFGLAFLFVWMKTWQVAFADGLKAHVTGAPPPRWTLRRGLRQAAVQTALQPYGFLAVPIAFALMIPFPAAHAFYQNLTMLGSDDSASLRDIARKAWRHALLWPIQNSVVIWLCGAWTLAIGMLAAFGSAQLSVALGPAPDPEVFGLWPVVLALVMVGYILMAFCIVGGVVAGNIAILLVALPELLRSLLGVDTRFAMIGWSAIFNTTFTMAVFALTCLCLDPLLKAAHLLRCFYGDALKTGEDLLVELQAFEEPAPAGIVRP